jgi:hypothetical protein
MMRFDAGGPPVWSIAMVRVQGPRPYWLWLTYGFSGVLTPVDYRAEYHHEYSIAVPCDDGEVPVWPSALLRHMCRYVLNSRAELRVGDNIPCHAPITTVPFAPEHRAMMPQTELDTLLVGTDPLLPEVDTPHGPVEVRRFVGLRTDELRLLQRWSGTAFFEEMQAVDPTLLTDLQRPSLLDHGSFRERAEERSSREGSSLGMLFIDGGWQQAESGGVEVRFPGGAEARLIREVLAARLPFDRPLVLRGPPEVGPVVFEPHEEFAMALEEGTLYFQGSLDHPQMQQIVGAIREDSPSTLRIGG